MSDSQSGSIDGISYASSKYVYDPHGAGFVTDILYYDQNGNQVADRAVFPDPPFATSGPTQNDDGTFSIKVTPPPGSGGQAPTYIFDTFSGSGIWLGEVYDAPVYNDPGNPASGVKTYAESGSATVNVLGTGSAGTIDGAYYDMTIDFYTAAGRHWGTGYYNDLDGVRHSVGMQYYPNPVIDLAPTDVATAGTPDTPFNVGLSDPWAAQHAGTLSLTISIDAGAASGTDARTGQSFSAAPGSAVHLTGTFQQINSDLSSLTIFDANAGTAHLTLQVYDQAGLSDTKTQAIAFGTSSSGGGTTGSSPDPVLGGPTTLTIPADKSPRAILATFSDPWAANHAGSLALNVSTSIGTLSDSANGTVVNGTSLHFTGSYEQIQSDIASLLLTSGTAGTGTVRIEIYDQAGVEAVHVVGVTAQNSASA